MDEVGSRQGDASTEPAGAGGDGWQREVSFVRRLAALPLWTLGLVVLFAVLHFAVVMLSGDDEQRSMFLLVVGGAKVNVLVEQGEWWRLVASAFLHGSFAHVLVNAVGVLLLGWYVENAMGAVALLAVFVLGSAGGAYVSVLADAPASVGASGGMFGLLGATLAHAAVRWRSIPRFIRAYVVGLPAAVGVFSVVFGLFAGNVDNFAHVGGAACGAGAGVAAQLRARFRWLWADVVCGLVCAGLVVAVVYSLGAALFHLTLRFELPAPGLSAAELPSGRGYLRPEGWQSGVFREGRCVLGWGPVGGSGIACHVDPFFSLLLCGDTGAMTATPVYRELLRRRSEGGRDAYRDDRIFWATDPERDLGFALLAFDGIAWQYESLFAAIQAPVRPAGGPGAVGPASP